MKPMKITRSILILTFGSLNVLAQNDVQYPFNDQGIWNDFHKKNVGKIVFSSQKIFHNSPDESLVEDTFDLTQPIKARIYIDKSLANKCAELEASGLHEKDAFNYALYKRIDLQGALQIDGLEPILFTMPVIESSAQKEQWTTWWYSLIPEENVNWKVYPENAWEYVFGKTISALSAGTHQVKISISMHCLDPKFAQTVPLVNGSFVLAFSESDRKVWLNKMQNVEADSQNEPIQSDAEIPSEYVIFKNNCREKIDIEYDSNGSTYSNTFIVSGGQVEFKMRTGDQLRNKDGTVLYTHSYGSSTTIYLCN
jgi:hypothetical protein